MSPIDLDESITMMHMATNLRESLVPDVTRKSYVQQLSDKEYIRRMTELREETLISKGFWYFILPSIILGIAGCFVPAVYVFLPVHETDVCLCSFDEASNLTVFD